MLLILLWRWCWLLVVTFLCWRPAVAAAVAASGALCALSSGSSQLWAAGPPLHLASWPSGPSQSVSSLWPPGRLMVFTVAADEPATAVRDWSWLSLLCCCCWLLRPPRLPANPTRLSMMRLRTGCFVISPLMLICWPDCLGGVMASPNGNCYVNYGFFSSSSYKRVKRSI